MIADNGMRALLRYTTSVPRDIIKCANELLGLVFLFSNFSVTNTMTTNKESYTGVCVVCICVLSQLLSFSFSWLNLHRVG